MRTDNWQRLGDLLIRRRSQLGFRGRKAFAREKHLTDSAYRIITAIENNERTNYDRETLIYVEMLYGWTMGSIERVLNGLDPIPVEESEQGVHISDERPSGTPRQELHRLVEQLPDEALSRVTGYVTAIVEEP